MKFLKNKTLWTNLVALVGSVLVTTYGIEVSTEVQATIVAGVLAVVNVGKKLAEKV